MRIYLYRNFLTKCFLGLFYFIIVLFPFTTTKAIQPVLNLSPTELKKIGEKIWQNECGHKISGLTSWNKGENFASLGIGHFIWYPINTHALFEDSFPKLIQYMRSPQWIQYMNEQHIVIPTWLDTPNIPTCPWQSREEFQIAIQNNEPRLEELRNFLVDTIPIQMQYIIYRFETGLEKILDVVTNEDRTNIQRELDELLLTPLGIYALIDYVNFKGEGINAYQNPTTDPKFFTGWGLLQVLLEMQNASTDLTTNQKFAWAAGEVLKHRVAIRPNDERWLPGWLNRVNTYQEKHKEEL